METLQSWIDTGLRQRVIAFLRECFPSHAGKLSDQELARGVSGSQKRAAKYGIESEQGLKQYAALKLLLGKQFDEMPAVNRYLSLGEPGGDVKMALLFEKITFQMRHS
jgi:hypothetical protein